MIAEFKNKKKSLKKEIIFWVLFSIISVVLIATLLVANIRMKNKRDRYSDQIEKLQKEIEEVENKKEELEETTSKADSKEHLERVAREQLGLKSIGEEVVVITKESGEENSSYIGPTNWWDIIKGERD